ncbi:MAG: hypothetical protein JSU63_03755 [Phycisphaerales bacterium]|nr:MAG: hypothetical protein JSU63_03755 [Phycisphaerales bacterium]
MVWKTYIMTLFVTGLILTALGLTSLWRYVGYGHLVTNRCWVEARVDDGNLRFTHARLVEQPYPRRVSYVPLGFFGRVAFASGTNRHNWRYGVLTLPLWTVVAVLFVHPAVAFVRGPVLRRMRKRRNQCISCGYNCAGNTSGVCPECGRPLVCGQCGCDLRGWVEERCPQCSTSITEAVHASIAEAMAG